MTDMEADLMMANAQIMSMKLEMEYLKKDRDAAVSVIEDYITNGVNACKTCVFNGIDACTHPDGAVCGDYGVDKTEIINWKWCGADKIEGN